VLCFNSHVVSEGAEPLPSGSSGRVKR
jgi:hypothetical protein